jgi:hypothetical protein
VAEDWRADVLATRGNIRIAFEVQWSRETLAETLARQERYARQGVRCCWFFRFPPRDMKRTGDEQLIEGRQDLPLFLLQQDHHLTGRVYLNGRHHSLDRFVAALLAGEVQFRSTLRISRWQATTIYFYDAQCGNCAKASHVYCLDRPVYTSSCGLGAAPCHRWYDSARAARRPEIQRAVWAFLQTDRGLRLRVGAIKPRPGPVQGQEYPSFGCFYCDAPFNDYALWKLEEEARETARWAAGHRVVVAAPAACTRERPHWCYPPNGDFCRNRSRPG